MKINTSRKAGFTLVEIMIVVAIIGLLAAIAIPNFVKARATSQSNACINNMRQIDSAVQQYALEAKLAGGDTVSSGALGQYIKGNVLPLCPAGEETYTVAGTYDAPEITCPNEDGDAHKLPNSP
jgi:prepilin-type N-terminal cleavage/methylation domain-containing protein